MERICMKSLPSPQEMLKRLSVDSIFKDWKKMHPKSFLSHFFCPVSADFKAKANWEIGYFEPEKIEPEKSPGKITIFTALENCGFDIKPADDVFKKPNENVEKLEMNKVRTKVDDAVISFQEKLKKFFPSEQIGDGFIILQTIKDETIWNFSFISRTLKFLNIKFNTENNECASHDAIELVQKQA